MWRFHSVARKEEPVLEPQELVIAAWGALSVFVIWMALATWVGEKRSRARKETERGPSEEELAEMQSPFYPEPRSDR
jgi:hypothetical protein